MNNWNGLGEPYWSDSHRIMFAKDCRNMAELPDESVQCVVTSPPYWGLRKYSGEKDLIWGDNHCEHKWRIEKGIKNIGRDDVFYGGVVYPSISGQGRKHPIDTHTCSLCGAWKGSLGLEPTIDLYIEHLILILREVKRVLRPDGVAFVNLGDSYFSGSAKTYGIKPHHYQLKPKDLCLIPFRVAIAAQEDGWWVRSVIIWSKSNPMPESATDRPTESHEYILMLTKSAKYYWDADAVREAYIAPMDRWGGQTLIARGHSNWDEATGQESYRDRDMRPNPAGRNIRSVFNIPQGYAKLRDDLPVATKLAIMKEMIDRGLL